MSHKRISALRSCIAGALLCILSLSFSALHAQAPQGFTYQAVVRNNDGSAVGNRQINVRVSLVQGNALGAEQYAEIHTPTTDGNGLFTIIVGQGLSLVNCIMADCIDWADGPWFIKTQIDPAGGNNFTLATTQQLMSVPYALFAANADCAEAIAALRAAIDSLAAVRDTVHIRDSVVVHIIDSVIVHDSVVVVYDTVTPTDTTSAALPGLFSINAVEQVQFSPGNLQYRASDSTWRFAPHQYSICGTSNMNISSGYNGWIDLFGYATSGYNGKMPYNASTSTASYQGYIICGTEYEWGRHNAISNGGNSRGLWRTLSDDEWNYITGYRANADSLLALATVAGVTGLVLLPDNWVLPAGISFTPVANTSFNINTYTAEQWETMEAAGAVFLPAAGVRNGNNVVNVGASGGYWSCYGYNNGTSSRYLLLNTANSIYNYVMLSSSDLYYGRSVRLVRSTAIE